MTRMVFSIGVLAALAACGGGTTKSKGTAAAGGGNSASGARAGSDVDALWAMAPSNAVLGMVVAPGATFKLYDMAAEMLRVIEARPFGAALTQEVRAKVAELPFDVFDRGALARAGIDLSRGTALFLDPDEAMTLVLPVSDRAAFRDLTKATLQTVEGTEFDRFDDGEFVCTEIQSLYVCMETPKELLARAGVSGSEFAERVYRLPASYRGDVELVMDLPAFEAMEGEQEEEFKELFSEYGLLAAVVQMGRGSVTARAWVQGKPRGDMQTIVEASQGVGSLSAQVARMRPSTLARMIIPMAFVEREIPDEELPGGLSLKRDVLGNMTGEFVAYAPSSVEPWGRLAFGITEPQGFRSLLNMGCSMIPMMGFMKVTPGENRCEFVIDYTKIPNLDDSVRLFLDKPLTVAVTVEDTQVAITVGVESPLVSSSTPSAIGQELLEKEWSYSLWTQNFSIISGLEGSWSNVIGKQPKDMQDGMRFAIWLASFVSEFAGAMSFQPDGMHMMAHIGTYAADESEPYAAYQAAVTKHLAAGSAETEFAEIRRQWPTSRAAQQSLVHSPFSDIFAKMVAYISLPAFVDYVERSKAVEGGILETPAP